MEKKESKNTQNNDTLDLEVKRLEIEKKKLKLEEIKTFTDFAKLLIIITALLGGVVLFSISNYDEFNRLINLDTAASMQASDPNHGMHQNQKKEDDNYILQKTIDSKKIKNIVLTILPYVYLSIALLIPMILMIALTVYRVIYLIVTYPTDIKRTNIEKEFIVTLKRIFNNPHFRILLILSFLAFVGMFIFPKLGNMLFIKK